MVGRIVCSSERLTLAVGFTHSLTTHSLLTHSLTTSRAHPHENPKDKILSQKVPWLFPASKWKIFQALAYMSGRAFIWDVGKMAEKSPHCETQNAADCSALKHSLVEFCEASWHLIIVTENFDSFCFHLCVEEMIFFKFVSFLGRSNKKYAWLCCLFVKLSCCIRMWSWWPSGLSQKH